MVELIFYFLFAFLCFIAEGICLLLADQCIKEDTLYCMAGLALVWWVMLPICIGAMTMLTIELIAKEIKGKR